MDVISVHQFNEAVLDDAVRRARARDGVLLVNTGVCGSALMFEERVRRASVLCSDYDGTAHPGNHWDAFRGLMTEEGRERNRRDALAYWAGDDRSDEGERAFLFRSVRLIVEAAPMEAQVEDVVDFVPRPGIVDFARTFGPNGFASVSYGLYDAQFMSWTRWLGVSKVNAYGVQLLYTPYFSGRRVSSMDCLLAATSRDKGTCLRRFCQTVGVDPRFALAFGDAGGDEWLFRAAGTSVMIYPLDDENPDRVAARRRALPRLWPHVDAVLVGNSWEGIAAMRQ